MSGPVEHQDKWLDSLSLEELKKWVRKNSCLCDMAGRCSGCQLADAQFMVRKYEKTLEYIASGEHWDEAVENARECLGTTEEDYL